MNLKKADNPYTLQFSYIPPKLIERTEITNEIISNFTRDVPTYRGIFITGVRGAGKTVMLGNIRNRMNANKEWICVDINPESDLLDSLAHALYNEPKLKKLFLKAKLDLSVFGLGLSIEKTEHISSNEEDVLRMMLQILKKSGKKILVSIDEVTYSKDVARFSHVLSSYASQNLDIFVLMTGLKDNINVIKNKKSLTFLYRAKVFTLDNLNILAISFDYKNTFDLDMETAGILAKKTMGYSLAFQALGYHYWNEICAQKGKKDAALIDKINEKLDITLFEMSYDKIWNELSCKDRQVLCALEELRIESGKDIIQVETVREKLKMTSDSFTTYRKRLMDAEIINAKKYGYIQFNLPRFGEFVQHSDEFGESSHKNNEEVQLILDYRELPEKKQKRLMKYLEMLKKEKE